MRPFPPEILLEDYVGIDIFMPAPELDLWARRTFLDDDSKLFNEDHIHLTKANIGWLWTNVPNTKGGNVVAATAEKPFIRGSAWQKGRQLMQFDEWFGGVPDFLIIVHAPLAQIANDIQFCGRIDHELYHCGQAKDEFGSPKFSGETDQPVFTIKGHDVEEHTGIMRRYGVRGCAGDTVNFIYYSTLEPEIEEVDILGACGNCLK